MPRMIITEKTSASPAGTGCGTKPRSVSSPLPTPTNPTPPDLTSSHPPLPTPPPTVTLQPEDGPERLDLLYMNGDSEDEDDLFTLSTTSSQVLGPSGSSPRGQKVGDDVEDKLAKLRAELERDMWGEGEVGEEERGGGCEDGGRCVTQLLHMVGEEEGEERGGGEECGDGGLFVTEEGDGGEGWCVDGGTLTGLHTLREEDEEDEDETDAAKNQPTEPISLKDSSNDTPPQLPPRDVTDGGMFSRPPPPPPTQEPEEEEVVFRGLVPLSCRCYYGREEEMKALKGTAEPVLTQAVALVHSSLGQWEFYLMPTHPQQHDDSFKPNFFSFSFSLREAGAAVRHVLSDSVSDPSERGDAAGAGVSLFPRRSPSPPRSLPLP